jgi:hypothetical protein
LRIGFLAMTLAVMLWFNFGQQSSAATVIQRSADFLDSRPPRSILIIGNSRTYYNGMPAMLRDIADSAGNPAKFQIETSAIGGATFKTHWEDGRTRSLLASRWDDVIFQPESSAQACQICNETFLEYGARLTEVAKAKAGRPNLVVGWAYDPRIYDEPEFSDYDYERSEHLGLLKEMHARLASDADLRRINVAGAWEMVRLSTPSIKLTIDGNHPTLAGTYLYALAVYAQLSNGPVASVTYVPDGLSVDDAKALREAVDTVPRLP